MTDDGRHQELAEHVEHAGSSPPPAEDLAASAASLLDAAEPADGVRMIRIALVEGSSRAVARRLLAALPEAVTVVGSTLPDRYDPRNPELDVLVETDHGTDAIASALADVDVVDGVVVADVAAGAPADRDQGDATEPAPGGDREGLSIYRLDDHLVVTDDLGALVERFRDELRDERALADVEDDMAEVVRGLEALADRVEAVESRVGAAADGTAVDDLRASVETLESDLEDLADAVDDAAAADELDSLWYHIESEVPSREELEYVFAPAARRIDGAGRHPDIGSAVEEIDHELRRAHALREAGLLGRLRWLLTGSLPDSPGEDE